LDSKEGNRKIDVVLIVFVMLLVCILGFLFVRISGLAVLNETENITENISYGPPVVEVKEVKSVTFGGATTDFDLEPNLQYVDDLVLEKPGKGVIKWTQNNIDVGGADFDSHVKFGKGSVSVDSANLNWELNSSANITLYDLEFAYTPAVYADGKVCTDCIIISYENGDFTFNVPHFTNYSAGVNTNLTIYDEYEGSFVYNGTNITFFANYTNITDGSHISGADCNISFDDDTSAMMTEAGSNYNYTKEGGFSTPGLHNWNVTCNVTNFETLNATDDVNVTTYCNGNYYGGNWIVNSSVYCSDEVIPVNGALTLRDDSETAVTQFSTIRGAAYDLSGNDAVITAAIPDLIILTASPNIMRLIWMVLRVVVVL
jgi:hypothetical protein